MKDKVLVQYEMCLHVEDFNNDFEVCRNASAIVRVNLARVLAAMFDESDSYKIGEIRFEEFDSSNPTHACAIFLCDVLVNVNDLFWCTAMRIENAL